MQGATGSLHGCRQRSSMQLTRIWSLINSTYLLHFFVGCIVNFIVSYLICMFQDSVPAGSYNDPFLSSVCVCFPWDCFLPFPFIPSLFHSFHFFFSSYFVVVSSFSLNTLAGSVSDEEAAIAQSYPPTDCSGRSLPLTTREIQAHDNKWFMDYRWLAVEKMCFCAVFNWLGFRNEIDFNLGILGILWGFLGSWA